MSKTKPDQYFFHGKAESTGVLLINLGTPDAPTSSAVRKYLREFLSDRRVVEIPRAIWLIILNVFVLTTRPAKTAASYRKIWREDGSPLLTISRKIQESLQAASIQNYRGPVHIEIAMRYGRPGIESALDTLQKKGARRILILPLYPQYSATTTATSFETIYRIMRHWRWLPEFRFVNSYHDSPHYINALAQSINNYWEHQGRSDHLLMSFHGIPKRNIELGDPYYCHCHKTGRLLADKLGLTTKDWTLSFQSRFGKAEWLQPYTDKTLESLPGNGVKSVDVVCPGFPVDCLETLEEIAMENRDVFMQAGGAQYRYIPALNNSQTHILALANIIKQHTTGWPETSDNYHFTNVETENEMTAKRAKIKGAKL